MRRAIALVLGALALAAPLPAAHAATSFTDVEDEVMCISCNVPLNVAESPQADATRREIRRLIDQGLSKDDVKDRLVAQYGPNVLAEPEDEGFGLVAYLVPVAAAALLIALLLLLLPRWRRRGETEAAEHPEPAAVSPDDERRLEADMALYDR